MQISNLAKLAQIIIIMKVFRAFATAFLRDYDEIPSKNWNTSFLNQKKESFFKPREKIEICSKNNSPAFPDSLTRKICRWY